MMMCSGGVGSDCAAAQDKDDRPAAIDPGMSDDNADPDYCTLFCRPCPFSLTVANIIQARSVFGIWLAGDDHDI